LEQYITIRTFTYPQDAFIIKGRLEADGIECFLKDEMTVQVDNFYTNALGGVKLQVREGDRERAEELLTEAGYLHENDFRPSAFWKTMDSFTRSIPLLKLLPLELRAVLVLTAAVLLGIGLFWIGTEM
jgi:hypothetical protein